MHICKNVKVTLVSALAALLSVAVSGCGSAGKSDGADEPAVQEQFSLTQYAAGSTIQAEAFTSKSSPNPQLENSNTDLGFFDAGTWFCFDNVDLTGVPSLDLRIAAANTGGVFSVRIDGNAGTEIGRYTVATATGGWATWATRTMPILATSGVHSLCLRGETNNGILNLDWLKLNQPALSYKVGDTIQAEALTSKSSPNPQLENGNTDVGFFDAGTWFCFAGVDLTNVASLDLRLAAANTGGVFTARLDSSTGTEVGRYTVATATGGWSTWQTRTMALTQTAGVHTLCLRGETNAGICNVDSLKLNSPPVITTKYRAGDTIQAEAFTNKSSPNPQLENNNTDLGFFDAGTWFCFDGVDMTGVAGLDVRLAAANTGGVFSARLDSSTGTEIGRYTLATSTGGWGLWETRTLPVSASSGVHTLCVRGETNSGICNVDSIKLNQPAQATKYRAGDTIQAEALTSKSTPNPQLENSNTDVGFFDAGTWFCFDGVDLTGVKALDLNIAAANAGGVFSARLDSSTGSELGRYTISTSTGGWSTWQIRSLALAAASGVHTLCLRGETGSGICNVDSLKLSLTTPTPPPTAGATTPFISYEAESGTLGGGATVVALTTAPTSQFSSPEVESSGHAYVQLNGPGQYVEWANNTGKSITFINVRASIPDTSDGKGQIATLDLYVDGAFRQALTLTSKQTWGYEGNNHYNNESQNPADGSPRTFFDEVHGFITGNAVAPGSKIRLQKGSANSAAFYNVDVVDLEAPPAPIVRSANSLSIVDDCGAVANNSGTDNTNAIQNCLNNAKAQAKSVWIPVGTFYVKTGGGLNANGVTIEGAGMWYSAIYRNMPLPNVDGSGNPRPLGAIFNLTSCTVRNFALDSNAMSRAQIDGAGGGMDTTGTNWTADGIWTQHTMSGFWASGTGGTVKNCRLTSIWADGCNVNNVSNGGTVGNDLTVQNNFVRGTGDDAIAINSVDYNDFGTTRVFYTAMARVKILNNTSVAPWGGKGVAIYGGSDHQVLNNYMSDTARYIGLGVGKFGANGSNLTSATVSGNVVVRCGGNAYQQQQPALHIGNGGDGHETGTVSNAIVKGNSVIDSVYNAVGFSASSGITFDSNTITHPGLDGIVIAPPFYPAPTGSASITNNVVTNLNAGRRAFVNNSTGFTVTLSGNNW